jgi:hypothetical protein
MSHGFFRFSGVKWHQELPMSIRFLLTVSTLIGAACLPIPCTAQSEPTFAFKTVQLVKPIGDTSPAPMPPRRILVAPIGSASPALDFPIPFPVILCSDFPGNPVLVVRGSSVTFVPRGLEAVWRLLPGAAGPAPSRP